MDYKLVFERRNGKNVLVDIIFNPKLILKPTGTFKLKKRPRWKNTNK